MTKVTDRVFSGIQPTGDLHLGNYLGAVRNWVNIQDQIPGIYCIVDYHAVTVPYDTAEIYQRMIELSAGLLACGLDPNKAILFQQSRVPQHTELAWIFNCVTPMGELGRQTQFKSKSDQHGEHVTTGLFTYPILQAADILLYKANKVPVGKDQEQHLELSREISRKFNARFGETFPEPTTLFTSTPKILGLDGQQKMSKSLNNAIGLNDDAEVIRQKLSGAFTDPGRKRRSDPGNPDVCNIYSLHKFFSPPEQVEQINQDCRSAKIGCVDCKKLLGAAIDAHTAPIREKWAALRARPKDISDVLDDGAKKCQAIADKTMADVHQKLGLRP